MVYKFKKVKFCEIVKIKYFYLSEREIMDKRLYLSYIMLQIMYDPELKLLK